MSADRDYLSARNVAESVRQSRVGDYTYLNNAKSGCSTIKYLLWLSEFEQGRVARLPTLAELHQDGFWPRSYQPIDGSASYAAAKGRGGRNRSLLAPLRRWLRTEKRRSTFVFSFVRNPFLRAFSSYRDKIGRPTPIRDRFCLQYGWDPRKEISFVDFLKTIGDSCPCDEDQHWRAQHHNIMFGVAPIDFIGNLEHYDEDIDELRRTIGLSANGEVKNAYKLKSETLMQKSFTDASIRLVLDKYRTDFESFGYGEDISVLAPLQRRKGSGAAVRAPGNLRYVNLLGQLEADAPAALGALERLAPTVDNPFILETAYSLARRQGEAARAERIAAACTARFPGHHVTLWLGAQEMVRTGRTEEARRLARELTRVRTASDAYWRLRHELTPPESRDTAAEVVRSLALLNPRSVDLQLRCAKLELESGNRAGAREAFERALRADPSCGAASEGLATLATTEGGVA